MKSPLLNIVFYGFVGFFLIFKASALNFLPPFLCVKLKYAKHDRILYYSVDCTETQFTSEIWARFKVKIHMICFGNEYGCGGL